METAVKNFSDLMQYKLDKNKNKECAVMNPDGQGRRWDECDVAWLQSRIDMEVEELREAVIKKKSAKAIAEECADIANFAMMIADNLGALNE